SEDLRYFTHEPVLEMMLYPALSKAGNIGPYPELAQLFRVALRSTDVLVAVGYRFRDEAVKQLVKEALFANPRLKLFLVSPGAQALKANVFKEKDLVTRVVCVPMPIESALQEGQLHRY